MPRLCSKKERKRNKAQGNKENETTHANPSRKQIHRVNRTKETNKQTNKQLERTAAENTSERAPKETQAFHCPTKQKQKEVRTEKPPT